MDICKGEVAVVLSHKYIFVLALFFGFIYGMVSIEKALCEATQIYKSQPVNNSSFSAVDGYRQKTRSTLFEVPFA